jgi:hypothetical protein
MHSTTRQPDLFFFSLGTISCHIHHNRYVIKWDVSSGDLGPALQRIPLLRPEQVMLSGTCSCTPRLVKVPKLSFYIKWSGVQFPPLPWFGDQLWLCGLIPHSAMVGVRQEYGKVKKNCNISRVVIAIFHPDQWGVFGVARANTAVGVSSETFLLLLLLHVAVHVCIISLTCVRAGWHCKWVGWCCACPMCRPAWSPLLPCVD